MKTKMCVAFFLFSHIWLNVVWRWRGKKMNLLKTHQTSFRFNWWILSSHSDQKTPPWHSTFSSFYVFLLPLFANVDLWIMILMRKKRPTSSKWWLWFGKLSVASAESTHRSQITFLYIFFPSILWFICVYWAYQIEIETSMRAHKIRSIYPSIW